MTGLMIFAAGLGTRMRPLTGDLPKALIQVAGRPLIDHALDLARAAGAWPIVVNTHHLADLMAAHLQGSGALISHEPQLLETGGGLRAALPLLGPGPVLLLNADAVWTGTNPLAQLVAAWDPARMDGLLLTLPAALTTGHKGAGDFTADRQGRLSRAAGRLGDVYLGAQIVQPQALAGLPEGAFSLNLLWDRLIGAGRLFGLRHKGGWCDVGHPGALPLAEAMLAGGA